MKLERILVIADKPKHDQVAWARAMQLAQVSGATLHLVGFIDPDLPHLPKAQTRGLRSAIIAERKQFLAELAAQCPGAQVTTAVIATKDLAAWVADYLRDESYDLVVKTAVIEKSYRTPTDWQLLRTCPAPLLLVINRRWPKRRNVLATLDLRHDDAAHRKLNDRVMAAATAIGALYDADVHLVHVVEVAAVLADLDLIHVDEYRSKRLKVIEPTLRNIREQFNIASNRAHVPAGKVGREVNRVADRIKAGLIVIGTTSRRGVRGVVIGNSAEKVLTHANTDILALKP